jgi:hypothetical protein
MLSIFLIRLKIAFVFNGLMLEKLFSSASGFSFKLERIPTLESVCLGKIQRNKGFWRFEDDCNRRRHF